MFIDNDEFLVGGDAARNNSHYNGPLLAPLKWKDVSGLGFNIPLKLPVYSCLLNNNYYTP